MTEDKINIIIPEKDPKLAAYREKIIENYPTLRDNFASAALTGILLTGQGLPHETLAQMAYELADAMMRHRKAHP